MENSRDMIRVVQFQEKRLTKQQRGRRKAIAGY